MRNGSQKTDLTIKNSILGWKCGSERVKRMLDSRWMQGWRWREPTGKLFKNARITYVRTHRECEAKHTWKPKEKRVELKSKRIE